MSEEEIGRVCPGGLFANVRRESLRTWKGLVKSGGNRVEDESQSLHAIGRWEEACLLRLYGNKLIKKMEEAPVHGSEKFRGRKRNGGTEEGRAERALYISGQKKLVKESESALLHNAPKSEGNGARRALGSKNARERLGKGGESPKQKKSRVELHNGRGIRDADENQEFARGQAGGGRPSHKGIRTSLTGREIKGKSSILRKVRESHS